MRQLIKPTRLHKGDIVAAVSLSWGGAGLFAERYHQGKRQFEDTFGVHIVEMPHTLKSPQEIYDHPEWRLSDLITAFSDKNIKAVITTIGGDDTIRLLRLMKPEHFDVMRNNPKIFLGMSDTTVNHLMCYKAGISSFYSPSLMFGYAENNGIPDYIVQNTHALLFDDKPIGTLPESSEYIIEKCDWYNEPIKRKRTTASGWQYIQGTTPARGRLIGGCMDVLDFVNGTPLWPSIEDFQDTILFLETSEECPTPSQITYWLRNLGAQGILNKVNGILFARPDTRLPYAPTFDAFKTETSAYDSALLQVLKEYDLTHIPVITHMDFGHTVPQLIMPYGMLTEINPVKQTVSFLENAVV